MTFSADPASHTAVCPVRNGLDRTSALRDALHGKRVGLVTNPSAVTREGYAAADVLPELCTVNAFFAPEHGIRGNLQNGAVFTDGTDPKTGKPVFNLYRPTMHLTEERVRDIDAVVYDIQDIGCRAYSYLRTIAFLIGDCIHLDRELVMLDRINPLGGEIFEGLVPEPELDRQWGFGVTQRFGLTHGEYAKTVNALCFQNQCRLTVIPCENWKREMMFRDCGLFWVNPSPNIPSADSALSYAGTAPFGQTNISEARGTARPYEMFGAPFADGEKIAAALNRQDLPGVFFRPCAFTAEYNAMKKYTGECCRGVQLFLTDRRRFRAFETGMRMLEAFRECCPEFRIPFDNGRCDVRLFDAVLGSADWRTGKCSAGDFIRRGEKESAEFRRTVRHFLLYR